MSKKIFLLVVAVALFTMAWILPCQAAKPVRIGYIGNLGWAIAKDAFDAVELAVEEINKTGGIQGAKVEVIREDSRGQTPMATAAYRKLVMTEGAKLIIVAEGSEVNFACQEAGASLYPEFPHVAMNSCTSHEELGEKVKKNHEKYKFYFRPFLKSTSYFEFMKENIIAMNHFTKAKTMALIIEDAQWTEYFRKGLPGKYPTFKEIVEGTGVKVVYYGETSVREKMYLPILDAIAATNPDYIYNLNAYSDDVIFCKQWASSGAKDIPFYNNGGASTSAAYWGMTGGDGLGVTSTAYNVEAAVTPKTIPYIKAMDARGKKDGLNWVSHASYDAVHLFKTATDNVKSIDIEAVIKELETMESPGVSGIAKFDDTHSYVYGYPYATSVRIQFQHNNSRPVVFPFEVAEKTNPDKHWVPVTELRKGR
ncbi:MAG: ABC transporter substrate-binding protein [Syntrophales bacterium]|jgi:branched-chain amino acid transport system substrate-binding protein|nr:ABC transporter substrate-binding protein [Syntrophales bacterium]MDY0044108.1 ABC transporter substrate-binding protein [Syntrophales bacterium]